MKIEQQVVGLELAKKLKELGLEQKSLFAWYLPHGEDEYVVHAKYLCPPRNDDTVYSAFTVAELGQELIIGTDTMWDGQKWQVSFGDHERAWSVREDTEADARAKMLIYLMENGLCT